MPRKTDRPLGKTRKAAKEKNGQNKRTTAGVKPSRASGRTKPESEVTAVTASDVRPSSALDGDSRYRVVDGVICAVETARKGTDAEPYDRKLCNFDARIKQDVARDDGTETTYGLLIGGRLFNGTPLPDVGVDINEFQTMEWVLRKWGARAIVHAGHGSKDKLREAIQVLSQNDGVGARTVYTHTGWRQIDGKRVYLTADGAIGNENVEVELDTKLARYVLPRRVTNTQARTGMKASLKMLDVAPATITLPLWGAMFLAPLSEILPPEFTIWLYGQTGKHKSTLAALALSHYGAFVDKGNLPTNWESTENAVEKMTFLAKDVPLVIDDFAPQASEAGARALEAKAGRILRAVGNRKGRDRMRSDTSLRASYDPRGLVISTGEQLPSGQSVLARVVTLEMPPGGADLRKLSMAQSEAGLYPQAMTGYIEWLSGKWAAVEKEIRAKRDKLKDEFRQGQGHLRVPEALAALYLGVDMGLRYAVAVGAITVIRAKALRVKAKQVLREAGTSHTARIHSERPVERYLEVIGTLLAQAKVHLSPGGTLISGDWIGWADDDYVYIQPPAAYHAVSKFCRDEGGYFPAKQTSLNKELLEGGYIVPDPESKDGSKTISKKLAGKAIKVLRFIRRRVEESWGLSPEEQ